MRDSRADGCPMLNKNYAEKRKVCVLAPTRERRLLMSDSRAACQRQLHTAQRQAREGHLQTHSFDAQLPEL